MPVTMKTSTEIGQEAGKIARCQTEQRLRRAGITRTYYMQKLKDLCEATKQISCIKGKEADGGTVDFIDVPDNQVQLGAIKTIIELYGDKAVPTQKHEIDLKQPVQITIKKFCSRKTAKDPDGSRVTS